MWLTDNAGEPQAVVFARTCQKDRDQFQDERGGRNVTIARRERVILLPRFLFVGVESNRLAAKVDVVAVVRLLEIWLRLTQETGPWL